MNRFTILVQDPIIVFLLLRPLSFNVFSVLLRQLIIILINISGVISVFFYVCFLQAGYIILNIFTCANRFENRYLIKVKKRSLTFSV